MGSDKGGKVVKVEGHKTAEKGILLPAKHHSLSPRKHKKATIFDGRAEQSVISSERGANPKSSRSRERKMRSGGSRSPSRGSLSRRSRGSEYRGYGPLP